MNKTKSFITCVAVTALLTSCDSKTGTQVATIDLVGNLDAPEMCDIVFDDVTYTPLDTVDEAYFGRAEIVDASGDTVIVKDNLDRLVMFDVADGRYLGQISHKGQGPGEYPWLFGTFVDSERGEALIMNRNQVYRYRLADDTYLGDYDIGNDSYLRLPSGHPLSTITIGEQRDADFILHNYDREFRQAGDIVLKDYEAGYISSFIGSSNCEPRFTVGDTLYRVTVDHLEPVVVLSRGDRTINPEIEREAEESVRNGKWTARQRLIDFLWFEDDGRYLMAVTCVDEKTCCDIYDLATGKMLYRKMKHPTVTWNGNDLNLMNVFVKDGVWYGIVDEETSVGYDNAAGDDMVNCGIVHFRLR